MTEETEFQLCTWQIHNFCGDRVWTLLIDENDDDDRAYLLRQLIKLVAQVSNKPGTHGIPLRIIRQPEPQAITLKVSAK